MSRKNRAALTAKEWFVLADLLEIASAEHPRLIGFRICETTARMLGSIRKIEMDRTMMKAINGTETKAKTA